MTVSGTSYDHLTMEELNRRIISGEISTVDLPNDLLSAWAAWEPAPVPMTSYRLADPQQRQDFLHQYCYQGEPALFAAVAHIWDSLAEPRRARCTAMGIAAGTGGSGKIALVLLLRQFLAEYLDAIMPLPAAKDFADLRTLQKASMAAFDEEEQRLHGLCLAYSAILDGAACGVQRQQMGELVCGPWRPKTEPV